MHYISHFHGPFPVSLDHFNATIQKEHAHAIDTVNYNRCLILKSLRICKCIWSEGR